MSLQKRDTLTEGTGSYRFNQPVMLSDRVRLFFNPIMRSRRFVLDRLRLRFKAMLLHTWKAKMEAIIEPSMSIFLS